MFPVFLQTYGVYGGVFGELIYSLGQAGFFSYLLPFLLIFAIVFGLLRGMGIFDKAKAVDAIIALAVGLMALQFDFVPLFFAEIFPRLGVGLAIFLSLLILAGFFIDFEKGYFRWILIGIGAVILIIVLIQSSGNVGWYTGQWWANNWPVVAGGILILVLVAIIVGNSNPPKEDKAWPMFWKSNK
jgi:hypothetical protein